MTEQTPLGFVGLGNLGLPMAITAQRAGFDVRGLDIAADRCQPLVEAGGTAVEDLDDLRPVGMIALAVLDDDQVMDVTRELFSIVEPGTVMIVHSTVLPETMERLGPEAADVDVHLLGVPVSGGDIAARSGDLTLMVGGDPDAIERAQSYFEAVGRKTCVLGGLGAGMAGKLANQMMTFVGQLAAVEAMKLAAAYGVSEADVVDLSATSTSDSWLLRNWGFFDRIHDEYEQNGTPDRLRPWAKDLWDVLVVARRQGLDLPLAALAAHRSIPEFTERAEQRRAEP